jgi:hypothetical protein
VKAKAADTPAGLANCHADVKDRETPMKLRTDLILALAVACGVATSASAECAAQGAATRPRLVELYTSEGCSSCPPADEWLRQLPAQANLTALEFHVDYWDSLGWRDRFADRRFSGRQQQQAARDGATGVFTPQLVLDGRNWSGWYRSQGRAEAATSSAAMRMTITPGPALHVRVDTTMDQPADAGGFRNYVAITEDGLVSQVRAGENRGALLRHDHVVRVFAGPLPLTGEADLKLPNDLDTMHATVVAFVQRESDGAVAQVLSCSL